MYIHIYIYIYIHTCTYYIILYHTIITLSLHYHYIIITLSLHYHYIIITLYNVICASRTTSSSSSPRPGLEGSGSCISFWSRTNRVDTNEAAAKVMKFDRLKKGTPWHFWDDKSRLTGAPKKFLCQKRNMIC